MNTPPGTTARTLSRTALHAAGGMLVWALYAVTRLLGRQRAMRIAGSHRVGRATATLVNFVIGKKNHCFERNLQRVFPGISGEHIEEIRQQTFSNLAKTAVETFFLSTRELSGITVSGREHLRGLEGRGVVFVSAHINTVYYLPLVTRSLGFECAFLRLAMPGALLEKLSRHLLDPLGIAVPSDQALRFAKYLRDGVNVAITPDLRVKGGRNAAQLPLCGHPAWTSTFIAELALTHGRPIVPVYTLRHADDRIEMVFEMPIDTSSGDKGVVQTLINDSIGARIMAQPGAWSLWNTNRWGP
jgi:lauroyl/myristoyl acyltransferase